MFTENQRLDECGQRHMVDDSVGSGNNTLNMWLVLLSRTEQLKGNGGDKTLLQKVVHHDVHHNVHQINKDGPCFYKADV